MANVKLLKERLLAELHEIEERKRRLLSQFLDDCQDDELESITSNGAGTVLFSYMLLPVPNQDSMQAVP